MHNSLHLAPCMDALGSNVWTGDLRHRHTALLRPNELSCLCFALLLVFHEGRVRKHVGLVKLLRRARTAPFPSGVLSRHATVLQPRANDQRSAEQRSWGRQRRQQAQGLNASECICPVVELKRLQPLASTSVFCAQVQLRGSSSLCKLKAESMVEPQVRPQPCLPMGMGKSSVRAAGARGL